MISVAGTLRTYGDPVTADRLGALQGPGSDDRPRGARHCLTRYADQCYSGSCYLQITVDIVGAQGQVKASEWAQKRSVHFVSAAFLASLIIAYESGKRLPYMYSDFAWNIRAFVISPLLLVFFAWGTLFYKWKETGRTGYQMAMDRTSDRRERIRQRIGAPLGALLISFGLPALVNYYFVWAAQWTASEPFAASYRIFDIKSMSTVPEVTMISASDHAVVKVVQTREQVRRANWKIDDYVCVRGRASLFGTIVESIDRASRC